MHDSKSIMVESMKQLLNEKKQELQDRMQREAFDKLGRDDFRGAMNEGDLSSVQSLQLLGVKLLGMG